MKLEINDLETNMQYLMGKEDGIRLALMIVGRRHVEGTSLQWLINERDRIRKQINELEEE